MNVYENLWCIRHIHDCGQDVFLMVSESQPTKEHAVKLTTALLAEGDQLTVRKLPIEDGRCVVLCECGGVHPGEPIEDEVLLFGNWPGDNLHIFGG